VPRALQYETNTADVRGRFEEHGEVKTFFDLIANRGMIFVTYVRRSRLVCVSHSLTCDAVRFASSREGTR
jgi:hypothetical protein